MRRSKKVGEGHSAGNFQTEGLEMKKPSGWRVRVVLYKKKHSTTFKIVKENRAVGDVKLLV